MVLRSIVGAVGHSSSNLLGRRGATTNCAFMTPHGPYICIGNGSKYIDLHYRDGHFTPAWASIRRCYIIERHLNDGDIGAAPVGGGCIRRYCSCGKPPDRRKLYRIAPYAVSRGETRGGRAVRVACARSTSIRTNPMRRRQRNQVIREIPYLRGITKLARNIQLLAVYVACLPIYGWPRR